MKTFATVLLALLLGLAAPARAADPAGAEAFIADLGNQTVEILQRPDLTAESSVAAFRDLFRSSFDVPTIGRFVLGRYWREATPEQQQDYLRLFEDMVIESYARRFGEYSGETIEVVDSRPEGDHDIMVTSRIIRPAGPPIGVVWRVRDRDGRHRIIDVTVEGISMAITQRNEFAAVIQRNGGRIDALLDALRTRIATAQQQS